MFPLISPGHLPGWAAALLLALGLHATPALAKSAPPAGLPTANDWKEHLEKDLMPFWMPARTIDNQPGNFPTYRCDDGSLFVLAKPCPELAHPASGIVWLDRDYLRMKSRQTYGYGVAYHVTGDPRYLALAREGAEFIMAKGFEKLPDGRLVPITFWTATAKGERVAGPPAAQRTSQDMAYSLTGIGFYYYLTRDPRVLPYLESVKDYIFDTFYDHGNQLLHWVNENFHEETTDRWELTAQLDQVYAYMLWLTPSLPSEWQPKWRADLARVAYVMKDTFYAGDCGKKTTEAQGCGLFWGDMTQGHVRQVGSAHTDYGHSVKTMWMIFSVGRMVGDKKLEDFGRAGAGRILKRAYDASTGSWTRAPGDKDKEWWILCELDQVAGTLALAEPQYARYLPHTWKYWKKYMVDSVHHEVWHLVRADGTVDKRLPKQHSWKNMLHSTEHVLVGYITSSQLYGKPVVLHFAWTQEPPRMTVKPYVYEATVQSIDTQEGRQAVTFTGIR